MKENRVFKGRLNIGQIIVGLILIIGSIVLMFIRFPTYLPIFIVALRIIGIPFGGFIMINAIFGAKSSVILSEESIKVGKDEILWNEIGGAKEEFIHRMIRSFGKMKEVGSEKKLFLQSMNSDHPEIIISTDWLSMDDYMAICQEVEKKVEIVKEERTES